MLPTTPPMSLITLIIPCVITGVKQTQKRHCNFCLKKINNINAYTEFADVKKKIKLLI